MTLTWDQVSDGQSGLEGYYAAFGDEAPTVQADSVISDTETWAGADTPATPYYVRARDNACAEFTEAGRRTALPRHTRCRHPHPPGPSLAVSPSPGWWGPPPRTRATNPVNDHKASI